MKTTQQRDALKRSEKRAAEHQPENFKDQATDDKQVEIGPDLTDAPIHGIDPAQRKSPRRVRRGDVPRSPPDDAEDRPPRTAV